MTTIIAPRVHDLGGFQVRRAVPTLQARSVGPFVFVDHMGPAIFEPGRGIDVRPHPHIGLATVTFLWSGTITHRDTLGCVQDITAGDVNWMTAGRGIAHSERTPQALREGEHPLHGMQTWVALPQADEEAAPAFHHHAAAALPQHASAMARCCACSPGAATARSRRCGCSPTRCTSRSTWMPTREVALDDSHAAARAVRAGWRRRSSMARTSRRSTWSCSIPASRHVLRAKTPLKAMLLGGEPLDGPRHLWWNFVSVSKERIEQAKLDWLRGALRPGARATTSSSPCPTAETAITPARAT